ncbi:hypothetical protein GQ53DRAFT_814597 [Thozetella sp. PMI_491]|nr:hypothetical protein GQ53DRAFT_814597 [Thozetella sp. PMI_491]
MPNLSLLSIPAMWLTIMVPHTYSFVIVTRANNGRYDNANSRGHAFTSTLQKTLPSDVLAMYERCKSAERNGFENLPLFAAAVLAANYAGVDKTTLDATAWSYVALRIVYTLCYINIKSQKKSHIRSGVWALSIFACMSLFARAAFA